MVPLLLLPLLWRGSVQQYPGYQLRGQELVIVQEGLCVLVPCSFFYPRDARYGELYMYLFRDGDNLRRRSLVATNNPRQQGNTETQGRFRFLGDPRTDYCSLSIRDARRSDTGVYSLQLQRGHYVNYNYREKKLNLQVTDMTEKPDIHFPELLESGRPTNLTCSLPGSCDGGRPLTFSWVGDAFDSLDPGTLQSPWLTLTLRPQDHGTNLTCRVKLQGAQVTTERTIQLNVSYAPQNLTIHVFSRNVTALKTLSNSTSLPVLEGQFLRLVCVADSKPPARMSWSREGKTLSPSQPSAPGVLELLQVGAGDGGEFTCRAQNLLGSQHVSFSLSVQRCPSSCSCVTGEQQCSWPLVLTLIRGALMGVGFLLTYGLTWIYYTRCGGP
ncbi:PREDICTED: sialic acid-binding Ig-like lectin 14 [Ceratotherium simum simum]|uniref:Sialic acid-binding Ig-like lectin 14 n=1 Tax=Ceratotherium simum simum TaxID=73337 RepID=A0ABM1DDB7_CERSS|nr:PREDICTED: sialic acid-binding Ig-like lectin 14 [Ceratotherium simum simum]